MIFAFSSVALIIFGGFMDRLIGWGGWGRTLPVVGAFVGFTALALGMSLGPAAPLFGLAWLAWRTPPWDLSEFKIWKWTIRTGWWLGGTINPKGWRQIVGTFDRHLLALAFVLPAAVAHVPIIWVAACMAAFASGATLLAVWNTQAYEAGQDQNGAVETLRGMMLCFMLALSFG